MKAFIIAICSLGCGVGIGASAIMTIKLFLYYVVRDGSSEKACALLLVLGVLVGGYIFSFVK